MEACATAHYWARELTKLGHRVRLMPAKDVKAYVKRNKNDTADAEAICEAVRRPTMRFVQIKSAEQQGRLMLHRTRDLLMRQSVASKSVFIVRCLWSSCRWLILSGSTAPIVPTWQPGLPAIALRF
jgi:transposase